MRRKHSIQRTAIALLGTIAMIIPMGGCEMTPVSSEGTSMLNNSQTTMESTTMESTTTDINSTYSTETTATSSSTITTVTTKNNSTTSTTKTSTKPSITDSTKPTKNPNADYGKAVFHFLNVNYLPFDKPSSPPVNVPADCILIQVEGKNVLIDGGERKPLSYNTAIEYFKKLGVKKFDLVLLTHAHSDHAGGLDDIIRAFDVDVAVGKPANWDYLTVAEKRDGTQQLYQDYVNVVAEKGGKFIEPKQEGLRIDISANSYIEIYNSSLYAKQTPNMDFNNMSLAFKFVHGDVAAFLAGDATAMSDQILSGKIGRCQLLKVAHHGSGGPYTTEAFLSELDPEIAILTNPLRDASWLNNYCRPTIERLYNHNVAMYSTGMNNNITVTSDGHKIVTDAKIKLLP